jgi:hypothetical protein
MNFKPATEEDIRANKVWPAGIYPFSIIDAEEKVSARKGNPMIELKIEVSKRDGSKRTVRGLSSAAARGKTHARG